MNSHLGVTRKHKNQQIVAIFLDLLSLLGNLGSVLEYHLNSDSVFKYSLHIIRNELLDCMYEIYNEELKKKHCCKPTKQQV